MKYLCPICKNGYIDIEKERTGPPGFRETDYNIVSKTCDCISYECETVAIAIMSYKDNEAIKNNICTECKAESSTIHYPVRPWLGEFKDICTNCFKKEMELLKNKYSKPDTII